MLNKRCIKATSCHDVSKLVYNTFSCYDTYSLICQVYDDALQPSLIPREGGEKGQVATVHTLA